MRTETWILGAPDPEMTHIESLLREAGERVAYATLNGQRVRPSDAYQADGPVVSSGHVYLVECDIPALHQTGVSITRIDHHREGDPGYGLGPDQFLPASSIGQVIALLCRAGILQPTNASDCNYVTNAAFVRTQVRTKYDWAPGPWEYQWTDAHVVGASAPAGTHDGIRDGFSDTRRTMVSLMFRYRVPEAIIMAAAADHCLAAAYRGECPGVDPDALMRWRVETRAKFQGRSVESLMADVERARAALQSAPQVDSLPGVADFRSGTIPELPEAAAREGIAFLATVTDRDGRKKVVLQAASSEQVKAFLREHPAQDKYGDPARGYAGGYLA